MTVPREVLRSLCIKNNWFNCGTNRQYDRLFDENEDDASIQELALIIWLCTEDENRGVIENQLRDVQIP